MSDGSDKGKPESSIPQPKPGDTGILAPGYTFTTLTDKLASIALSRRTPFVWSSARRWASSCR